MSQIVSLSGSITLFIEICKPPWKEYQPVGLLQFIKHNKTTEHKGTSTFRNGFETAIQASGFSRHETHCMVRPY